MYFWSFFIRFTEPNGGASIVFYHWKLVKIFIRKWLGGNVNVVSYLVRSFSAFCRSKNRFVFLFSFWPWISGVGRVFSIACLSAKTNCTFRNEIEEKRCESDHFHLDIFVPRNDRQSSEATEKYSGRKVNWNWFISSLCLNYLQKVRFLQWNVMFS